MQKHRPVMLVVLDGWGWREDLADNAVRQAQTPIFDRLWGICPHSCCRRPARTSACLRVKWEIRKSDISTLVPGGSSCRICNASTTPWPMAGSKRRPRWSASLRVCVRPAVPATSWAWLHRAACIPIRITRLCWRCSSRRPASPPSVVHAFADGRDTPPRSAKDDIKRLNAALPPSVPIATVCGRYYAMDRGNTTCRRKLWRTQNAMA